MMTKSLKTLDKRNQTVCARMMFDTICEGTSYMHTSKILRNFRKIQVPPAGIQTCDLMIACSNAALLRYRKFIDRNCH